MDNDASVARLKKHIRNLESSIAGLSKAYKMGNEISLDMQHSSDKKIIRAKRVVTIALNRGIKTGFELCSDAYSTIGEGLEATTKYINKYKDDKELH